VTVGRLDATGLNLKALTIDGDVSSITVGAVGGKLGIKTLKVGSLGQGIDSFPGLEPKFDFPGGLKKLIVGGDVTGIIAQGDGDFGSIKVQGKIVDTTVKLAAKVKSLVVIGDIVNSEVRTNGSLTNLIVGGAVIDSEISARGALLPKNAGKAIAFGKVQIGEGFVRSELIAGYDKAGVAINPDANIGSIVIGGNFEASSIVAGATAGANTFFGDEDDTLIAGGNAVVARIAKITIKGTVLGSAPSADHFGIVAEQIGKLKIGGETQPLTRGPGSDSTPLPLGGTADVTVLEVAAV